MTRAGAVICHRLTPEAFRATISLSALMRLKTSTVETRMEKGRA